MQRKIVTIKEHYDLLIEEGNDPLRDNPLANCYMEKWDGPKFYDLLNVTKEKNILEIGVGTGRVAFKVLSLGCNKFTGIDISPKSITRVKENLLSFKNADFLTVQIENFIRKEYYDIAYSVLTFMLIEDKRKALKNIVLSLKVGGEIIISIPEVDEWFEFDNRKHKNYLSSIDEYIKIIKSLNCEIKAVDQLIDYFLIPGKQISDTYGKKVGTLIKAKK
jgi:SAM-dependent methyltransferase